MKPAMLSTLVASDRQGDVDEASGEWMDEWNI